MADLFENDMEKRGRSNYDPGTYCEDSTIAALVQPFRSAGGKGDQGLHFTH